MRSIAFGILLLAAPASAQTVQATIKTVNNNEVTLDKGSRQGLHVGEVLVTNDAAIDVTEVAATTAKGKTQRLVTANQTASFLPWKCGPFPNAPVVGNAIEGHILSASGVTIGLSNGARADILPEAPVIAFDTRGAQYPGTVIDVGAFASSITLAKTPKDKITRVVIAKAACSGNTTLVASGTTSSTKIVNANPINSTLELSFDMGSNQGLLPGDSVTGPWGTIQIDEVTQSTARTRVGGTNTGLYLNTRATFTKWTCTQPPVTSNQFGIVKVKAKPYIVSSSLAAKYPGVQVGDLWIEMDLGTGDHVLPGTRVQALLNNASTVTGTVHTVSPTAASVIVPKASVPPFKITSAVVSVALSIPVCVR